MKYKKLTKEQIIISIDRLTRFKPTKEKYLRVYTDIIVSNLTNPVFKKKDIENMDYAELTGIVTEIFNNSLDNTEPADLSINKRIRDYENSVFNNDDETQKLLNNGLNYREAIKLIPRKAPLNLLWLKNTINSDYDRESSGLKYPLEVVLLVEGITEEILLPEFAKILNYDFDFKGVQIIASGGKNQVVKMYYKLSKEIKLPIFTLLDRDAEENINQIKPKLRTGDKIHLVSCGEFEDMLTKELIIKTVNSHFKNFLKIDNADMDKDEPTVKILEELFKTRGLHEFKKAEFAKLVKENIKSRKDVSDEIETIITELSQMNK